MRTALLPSLSSNSIPLKFHAHAAVAKKHRALRKRGNDVLIERRTPVKRGATIPASRERADAIPAAVPLCATNRARPVVSCL